MKNLRVTSPGFQNLSLLLNHTRSLHNLDNSLLEFRVLVKSQEVRAKTKGPKPIIWQNCNWPLTPTAQTISHVFTESIFTKHIRDWIANSTHKTLMTTIDKLDWQRKIQVNMQFKLRTNHIVLWSWWNTSSL